MNIVIPGLQANEKSITMYNNFRKVNGGNDSTLSLNTLNILSIEAGLELAYLFYRFINFCFKKIEAKWHVFVNPNPYISRWWIDPIKQSNFQRNAGSIINSEGWNRLSVVRIVFE